MGDHLSPWDFARRPVEEVRNCSARAGQRPLLRAVVPFMEKTCRSAKGRFDPFGVPSGNGLYCANLPYDGLLEIAEKRGESGELAYLPPMCLRYRRQPVLRRGRSLYACNGWSEAAHVSKYYFT